MTTLASIHPIHADRTPTDDERRMQWRKRAGTLPPDGSRGVALQLVEASAAGEAPKTKIQSMKAWSGLFLGSLWTTPIPAPVKPARSHRRISAVTYLRATA